MLAAVLVCLASAASAQTPESWTLRLYQNGTLLSLLKVSATEASCGQVKVPITGEKVVNPTVWRWDDPADTTRECFVADARLLALPDGEYAATIEAVNAVGPSSESAPFPFSRWRPRPPAVPTGLRLTP